MVMVFCLDKCMTMMRGLVLTWFLGELIYFHQMRSSCELATYYVYVRSTGEGKYLIATYYVSRLPRIGRARERAMQALDLQLLDRTSVGEVSNYHSQDAQKRGEDNGSGDARSTIFRSLIFCFQA